MTADGKSLGRRAALLQMAGGATMAIAPLSPNLQALAQATPMRRSIGAMAPNDPTLVTFRKGVRLLKARPASDVRSWARLAAIHGSQAAFNKCPHGNWYFLPWHRAYLLTYERLIRWVTGDATFAMPYWDWTTHRGLPQAFASPTVGGQPNPLYVGGRVLTPNSVLPDNVVGPAVMANIQLQTAFELFGSSRPQGQNSADVSWLAAGGVQGPLENNPHNQVHGRVGGVMASGASPIDPVFMTHHCNLDRLWADWNGRGGANPALPMWRDTPFTGHFINTSGAAWSPKVKELVAPSPLALPPGIGYRYPPAAALQEPLPSGQAASSRLTHVLDALQGSGAALSEPAGPDAARGVLGRRTVGQTTVPGRPVSTIVEVDLPRLAAAAAAGAGLTESGPTQALVIVRDITPPEMPDVEVRVFLNLPGATDATPTDVPHFAGSFGFFGGPHAHGVGGVRLTSLTLDVTGALQALRAAGQPLSRDLSVQFVPVALGGAPGHRLRIGEVAIAII